MNVKRVQNMQLDILVRFDTLCINVKKTRMPRSHGSSTSGEGRKGPKGIDNATQWCAVRTDRDVAKSDDLHWRSGGACLLCSAQVQRVSFE